MSHAAISAICIGCGCDDDHACWDDAAGRPCCWTRLGASGPLGVCSACPEYEARWEQGDRTVAVPVEVGDS